MTARLEAGDNLILFPEGTSNDGNRVLPFKSAFFGIAEKPVRGKPLVVQPVSIAYTRLNGIPMGRPYRALLRLVRRHGARQSPVDRRRPRQRHDRHSVSPPVTIEQFRSRKEMAEACQIAIADGVSRAISGKLSPRSENASGHRDPPESPSPARAAGTIARRKVSASTASVCGLA